MHIQEILNLFPHLKFLSGEKDFFIKDLCSVEYPKNESLVFIKNEKTFERWGKFLKSLSEVDEQSMVVVVEERPKQIDLTKRFKNVLSTPDLYSSMVELSKIFYQKKWSSLNNEVDGRQMGSVDIHPSARISQNVFIGDQVIIGANVQIMSGCTILGPARIDENCTLFPNVVIYPFTVLGKNARVHAGAVIGSDGFGYHFQKGIHDKIWQLGGVEIASDVEIGACSTIDGGTFHPTTIGVGCKIDNSVQIGHNCRLGNHVILCGHVGLSGSSDIGDFTVFGGKAGCGPGITLGKGVQVAGGCLINCDWPDKTVLGGHPARPLKEWMKGLAYLRKMSLKE